MSKEEDNKVDKLEDKKEEDTEGTNGCTTLSKKHIVDLDWAESKETIELVKNTDNKEFSNEDVKRSEIEDLKFITKNINGRILIQNG